MDSESAIQAVTIAVIKTASQYQSAEKHRILSANKTGKAVRKIRLAFGPAIGCFQSVQPYRAGRIHKDERTGKAGIEPQEQDAWKAEGNAQAGKGWKTSGTERRIGQEKWEKAGLKARGSDSGIRQAQETGQGMEWGTKQDQETEKESKGSCLRQTKAPAKPELNAA